MKLFLLIGQKQKKNTWNIKHWGNKWWGYDVYIVCHLGVLDEGILNVLKKQVNTHKNKYPKEEKDWTLKKI